MPLTEICNAHLQRPAPAPAVQEHHLCRRAVGAARHRARGDREAVRRAVQGQGEAARRQPAGAAAGPRLCARAPAGADRRCRCGAPTRSATASSSTATPPRRSAASTAAPRSAPGTRSRRRPRWPRPSRATASKLRVDPETGKNRYAIVQAEDELASIGMVIGAGWNGARAFTATSGPGHLADERIPRPRLFRRDPGRASSTCSAAARRPACRRARSSPTSARLRLRLARRHQARAAVPGRPARVLRASPPRRFDLADRLQTPVFVMTDLDIGMNEWLCEPFAWDDSRALRPRQGDDAPRSSRPGATSAATSMSTATASPTAPTRARIRPRAPTSPAAPRDDALRPLLRGGAGLRRQHGAAAEQVRDRATLVPQPVLRPAAQADRARRHLLRLDQPGDGRGAGRARGATASTSTRCACAPSRSRRACASSSRAHDQVFVVEQNRDAQMRTLLVNEARHRPGAADPASCTTTARRSPRASSPATIREQVHARRRTRRPPRRPRMTYIAKPKLHHPTLRQRTRSASPAATTKARSPRCAPAAATTRSRRRSSRPAASSTSSRTASPSSRASAARRRRRLFPRRLARLQHRARAHAVGADRRQPGQPRPDLPRRLRRRRLGLDRPRPVRARRCAAASTWSTSSRTTASTA